MAKRLKIPYRPDEPSRKPASTAPKKGPVKPPLAIVLDKKKYALSEQGQKEMQGSYDQDIMIEEAEKEEEIRNAPPPAADAPSTQETLMKHVKKKLKRPK